MRPAILGLAALAGVVLAGGCARRETQAAAAIHEDTLLLGNGAEPEDLDPQVVTIYTDQNILLALFEGLAALDERTSQAVPAAAQSWESSPDGLSWTFHLRAGLRWSNGEPLTAGDFVASWRRMLSPELAFEYAYLLYPIRNAEAFNAGRIKDPALVGVAAPDERTLVFTLEVPTPYFPILTALPPWYPINPRVLGKFGGMDRRGTAWTKPGNFVGNGPFALEEWIPNARVVVSRNPSYWNARGVRLKRIAFYPIDNPETEENGFRAGQLHITYALPLSRVAFYRREAPDLLRVDPFLQTNFLRFNVKRPPFDDPRVRRAFSLAINRDVISRRVLFSGYPPAHAFTPPNCAGYTPRVRVGYDPKEARALLTQAGYPGGKGFPAVEVQVRSDGLLPSVLEAIQEMWHRELGIHVSLAVVEQKTLIQNMQTLNYAVSTAAWAADFVDPVTFLGLFATKSGNNWTGWGDPDYDALIEEANRTLDPKARLEVFQKAEARLLDQAPVAPLFFGAHFYLIRPDVKGWAPALLGYHQYARVHFATP